jgi:hypothetical protein
MVNDAVDEEEIIAGYHLNGHPEIVEVNVAAGIVPTGHYTAVTKLGLSYISVDVGLIGIVAAVIDYT